MPSSASPPHSSAHPDVHLGYIWTMTQIIAAMGGLLFGYDWVVIGGAKPFYEVYFHLTSEALIGWANGCALFGCFAGSLLAGTAGRQVWPKSCSCISALFSPYSSIFRDGPTASMHSFLADHRRSGHRISVERLADVHCRKSARPCGEGVWSVSINSRCRGIGILAAPACQLAHRRKRLQPIHFEVVLLADIVERTVWLALDVHGRSRPCCSVPLLHTIHSRKSALACRPGESETAVEGIASNRRPKLRAIGAVGNSELAGSPSARAGATIFFRPAVSCLPWALPWRFCNGASGINILFNYAQEVYCGAGYGVSEILSTVSSRAPSISSSPSLPCCWLIVLAKAYDLWLYFHRCISFYLQALRITCMLKAYGFSY